MTQLVKAVVRLTRLLSQHRLVQLSSGNLPFCAQAMQLRQLGGNVRA
jgi:hypothetical protein